MNDVLEFIREKGECTGAMVTILRRDVAPVKLFKLFKQGKVLRRQVVINPDSSQLLWAYRLLDQEPTLQSYPKAARDPITGRIVERSHTGEPMHCYILRNMGRVHEENVLHPM